MGARTIHPFPARMAPEIALDAIPNRGNSTAITVLDPMCGSGTVLSAALSRGQKPIGFDIDPLAVLMSRVATSPINTSEMTNEAQRITGIAKAHAGMEPWTDPETGKFVDFWFGSEQRRDLIALVSAIGSVADDSTKAALQVALSRIIITKTPQASLAADTSHSRPHRTKTVSDYDVFQGFQRSVRSLARLLGAREASGTAEVSLGDSRILDGFPDGAVDLAVTSPPYLNALDYMRGHKLALVWLGYSIPELRKIRSRSIGSERAPDAPPTDEVSAIVAKIREGVAKPDVLPAPMIKRFAIDMYQFATTLQRTLKPGAAAVLVVGNSTLRGNYIQNDLITRDAMQLAGFEFSDRTERDIPENRRYMAINTNTSSLGKRMRTEVVLTMRRANG